MDVELRTSLRAAHYVLYHMMDTYYVENESRTRTRNEGIEHAPKPCSSSNLLDKIQNKNTTASDENNSQ